MKKLTAAVILASLLCVSACAGHQLPDAQQAAVEALEKASVVCASVDALPGAVADRVASACDALRAGVGSVREAAQGVLDATRGVK